MQGETKFLLGIGIVSLLIVGIAAFFLTRPEAPISRSELVTKDAAQRGKKDAKVYLVEFSDFQCPACLSVKPVVDQILKKHESEIVFVYRHFPLEKHTFARKAAEVAEAAGEQGKFWQMYDYLFAHQSELSEEMLDNAWKPVGLKEESFKEALASGRYKAKVQADISDGTRFGIFSTPTFFLNGRKLTLQSFQELSQEVDRAVKAAQ